MKIEIIIKNGSAIFMFPKNLIEVSPSLKVIRKIYDIPKRNNIHRFILDCSMIDYIDDSGIDYLLGLYRHMQNTKTKAIFKNVSTEIINGLRHSRFTICYKGDDIELWE